LGLPILKSPKPITLLGGLTSFGGAGNNYSMHALTDMVRHLRKSNDKYGLILANGGVVTYQHVVCLSKNAPDRNKSYPEKNPLPEYVTNISTPQIEEFPEGPAVIEVGEVRAYKTDEQLANQFTRHILLSLPAMESLCEDT
jgi:hypothetical protein